MYYKPAWVTASCDTREQPVMILDKNNSKKKAA